MTTTPLLGMTQLASAQAAPETAVNENDQILEFFAAGAFKSRATTAEPGSPSNGDGYLLPGSPTGTHWSGQGGKIALYLNTAWKFFTAKEGMKFYVNDEDVIVAFDGTNWNISSKTPPNVQAVTSSATVTPTFSNDLVKITAQAAGLTLANWSGTAVPGWGMAIRVKDNGSSQTISYGAKYRAIGVTLPTATTISKTLYLGCIYNSDDDKIDVVAVAQEA